MQKEPLQPELNMLIGSVNIDLEYWTRARLCKDDLLLLVKTEGIASVPHECIRSWGGYCFQVSRGWQRLFAGRTPP